MLAKSCNCIEEIRNLYLSIGTGFMPAQKEIFKRIAAEHTELHDLIKE